MNNLYGDDEEEQIEARIRRREAEILAEIDGEKGGSASNASVVLTGLAIAFMLSLPALGFVVWQRQRAAAVPRLTPIQVSQARPIVWYYTLQEGLNAAAITQKPMMIDFYTTWCGPCKMLDANTYSDAAVMVEAQNFISVKIDAEYYATDAARYGINSYPTIVWTDSAGNERRRISGAYPPDRFLPIMQQYRY